MNPLYRLSIGIGLCILSSVCWTSDSYSQELDFDQASHLFGPQRVLTFRQFSLDMTDQSKSELKLLADLIRQYPGIIATHLMVVQIFSCEKELKIKPYLGVCRGQVVVDYLEKELGLSRKKCLIRDGGKNTFDPNCSTGSGTYLYLRPSWTE
ncbi:MAG: hypothetical protein AAF587_39350 [Bacteroidota bacterium]